VVTDLAQFPQHVEDLGGAVMLPGQTPGPELLERTDAIRRQWICYWSEITGGVGTMSTRLDIDARSGMR
jgi:hypothetical protein